MRPFTVKPRTTPPPPLPKAAGEPARNRAPLMVTEEEVGAMMEGAKERLLNKLRRIHENINAAPTRDAAVTLH